ncbi:hypothetical protein L4D09_23355 [Photobacterium makurazakiensis]|uniref:hypothetical protein n=1 Tax=Photobacterium makurazakiensis TaxID=2910234 RepID=UPI003D12E87E
MATRNTPILLLKTGIIASSLFLMACGGSSSSDEGALPPDDSNGNPVTLPVPEPEVPVDDGLINVDGEVFSNLTEAQAAIKAGSLVVFGKGVYSQGLYIGHDDVTVQGSTGTHFKEATIQGKATFVVSGDDVSIEGIECSGVSVPDENGACVRQQGRDLTLSHVYFHDSEQGVLSSTGTGKLTIEYSTFDKLGKAGQAHAVYSQNDSLEIRYSKFYSSKDQGHEIKSRAAETLIEYSEIASLSGVDSRLVDVPNGGKLTIRDSVLEQGPNTSNYQLVGYGLEGMKDSYSHTIVLENNIVLMERVNGNVFLGLPSDASGIDISITSNDFIGRKFNDQGEHDIEAKNDLYLDRPSYGLGPFPELPSIGL